MTITLPSEKEACAARAWARRRLGYLPPGWDDNTTLMNDGPLARWLATTADGQRVRRAVAVAA